MGFILWRLPWRRTAMAALTVALVVYIACVGASRVVLGVHYPTDVLGGFLLGVAWVALLATVSRGMDLYRESQRSPDR